MARETINRCVWLVDTLRRYKRLTRGELDRLWLSSALILIPLLLGALGVPLPGLLWTK